MHTFALFTPHLRCHRHSSYSLYCFDIDFGRVTCVVRLNRGLHAREATPLATPSLDSCCVLARKAVAERFAIEPSLLAGEGIPVFDADLAGLDHSPLKPCLLFRRDVVHWVDTPAWKITLPLIAVEAATQ